MNFIYPEQSENIYDSEKHKFKNKAISYLCNNIYILTSFIFYKISFNIYQFMIFNSQTAFGTIISNKINTKMIKFFI